MTTDKSADDAVLDELFSSSRDRGADPAASKAEPEVQTPEPEAEKPAEQPSEEPAEEAKPQGYRDPSTGRFVPLKELTSEREKRQAAEKERDENARLRREAEDNAARYRAEVEASQRRFQAAQNPPPAPPDPLMDPEGALSHMQQTFEQKLINQNLNFSEARARDKFGDETVDKALKAAVDAGVAQHFVRSPNAYQDMIKWHNNMINRQRVGDDVDAFEKRIREEERQKTIEELKAGRVSVMPGQTPQQPQRFPGSLVDATASGPQGAQAVSDEAIAANTFSSNRKRR